MYIAKLTAYMSVTNPAWIPLLQAYLPEFFIIVHGYVLSLYHNIDSSTPLHHPNYNEYPLCQQKQKAFQVDGSYTKKALLKTSIRTTAFQLER